MVRALNDRVRPFVIIERSLTYVVNGMEIYDSGCWPPQPPSEGE